MKYVVGISDSLQSVLDAPAKCERCGSTMRVARDSCLSCLLTEGFEEAGEDSHAAFEEALSEVDVPDANWQLGNYQILGEIGRGGMGIIYRAQQRGSRRIVAVKRVLSYQADSQERIERFRREAEAAASLDHPHILPIYEVGETDDGCPYFSMKWATGGSLRDVGPAMRKDPRGGVALIAKVARAIEFAHERGILHRDLQPGNILLDSRGEPLVSDFGLAKWLDDETDLTRTQSTFGTPGFIAPEQAHGSAGGAGAAADIYGLGAILFYLLAGRPPFMGSNALHVIQQAADTTAPRLRSFEPALDRDLETIVARCLEREPTARYKTAAGLAEDLERWLDGRPIVARPVLLPAQLWRWSRRNPALATVVAVCLLLGMAIVFLLRVQSPFPRGVRGALHDKSLAVLPFENLGKDPENSFFADGIQEEILTNLAKVAALKVISRSSSRTYKAGLPRDFGEVGRTLGVQYVLEGSVRRSDGRFRINTQLLDTATGKQLWADQYDRDIADVFLIQSEIAKEIAHQLQARLSPTEAATIEARPTQDLAAYELYLRAQEIGQRAGLDTAERINRAVGLLDQAVARDPAFVPALCLLARLHLQTYWSNHDHTPARLEAAQHALERAERLGPYAGEVHLTRAILHYWGKRDYDPALKELEIARQALPNDADIPYFEGLILRRQGKWEESTRRLEAARATDPRNQVVLFDLARTNYFALKRYRQAQELCEGVIAWNPAAFDFQLARAKVDLAARADVDRWSRVISSHIANSADPDLLAFERLEMGLTRRDYDAAEEALKAHPLPEFNWSGYVTPREWYQGLIALGRGEEEAARVAFTAARDRLKNIVGLRPDDAKAMIVLGEIEARLGDRDAITTGEEALKMRPVAKDAVDGPNIMSRLAGIYAQLGEVDRALDLLEVAARRPNGTNYGALRLESTWDPLRTEPRFQKILDDLARPGQVTR